MHYWRDSLPADARNLNGGQLACYYARHGSPFKFQEAKLFREVEERLKCKVTGFDAISCGANFYGLDLTITDEQHTQRRVVARIARGDVTRPDFEGFSIEKQTEMAILEATVYELLRKETAIPVSRLLYYRVPELHNLDKIPEYLLGRCLFVFERAKGDKEIWTTLTEVGKLNILHHLASFRALLYLYNPPLDFVIRHLYNSLEDFKPEFLSKAIAPTRDFWMHVLLDRINATIRNEGDPIGWESDNEVVGPKAIAAKKSLLRAIPHIMPKDELNYRIVLEQGDFGIHNC